MCESFIRTLCTSHSILFQLLLQGSVQNLSADPVPHSHRANTVGTWMEMQRPEFPAMFLVPASPCISQKAPWAFSLHLSKNPALLILLLPRRILRANLSDFCVVWRLKPCSRWREPSQSELCPALLWLIDFLLLGLPLITFLLLSHFHPFQLFLLFQPFLMPPAPTWWIGCSESWSWPGLGPSPGNQWCHTDRKWCPNNHPGPFAPLPTGRPPGWCPSWMLMKWRREKLKQKWRN